MSRRDRLFFNGKVIKKKLSKNHKSIGSSFNNEPIWVQYKGNWIDHISKFAALAAVLLALVTVVFDCSQSKKQARVFDNFEENIDSLLNSQIVNDSMTIEALKQQQVQNDSTINILKIQAKRLEIQNNIWKINQKNQILTERAKLAPIIEQAKIKNDSFVFRLSYSNKGLRTAKNIECMIGLFLIQNNQISMLQEDQKAPFSMKNIVPGNGASWSINREFSSRKLDDKMVFIYSKITYEDEMFINPFSISDFIRVFNKDSITTHSFCSEELIDFIEKKSHYKDYDFENYTIKSEFLFN